MQKIDYSNYKPLDEQNVDNWIKVGTAEEFPEDGGLCFKHRELQIAVFNFTNRNEWFACQNLCPHKMQMILSRGMIGSQQGEPKVACPFHKKTFSLKTGECLNGDECRITTFPVKEIDGEVYVGLMEHIEDITPQDLVV
ncbi:nitrite reductase small subunit NirD [Olivibacter sp. CPCC 100613]|uniref:nitrite reductase small subunit NirD n=1 Tax=Olivibacter sp. CPCC 100613 TaxID=3079931 RepID=UPI002FF49375